MNDGTVKIKIENYVFAKDCFDEGQGYYVGIPVSKVINKLRGWLNRELPATPEDIGYYVTEECHKIALELGLIKTPFYIYDIRYKPRWDTDKLFPEPLRIMYNKELFSIIDSRRRYKSFLTFCKHLLFDIRIAQDYVGRASLHALYTSLCESGCKEFAERVGPLWYNFVEILIYAMRRHARNHKVLLRDYERLKRETLGRDGYRYLKLGFDDVLGAYFQLVDAVIAENSAKFIKKGIQ